MRNDLGGAWEIDTARELASATARLLEDGKGEKVVVLSVGEMTLIADYFVIASGASQRHVKALADRVLEGIRDEDERKPHHVEGLGSSYWILLDYGDVVVHVFREAERAFYGLERLWGDAPRLERPPLETHREEETPSLKQ